MRKITWFVLLFVGFFLLIWGVNGLAYEAVHWWAVVVGPILIYFAGFLDGSNNV